MIATIFTTMIRRTNTTVPILSLDVEMASVPVSWRWWNLLVLQFNAAAAAAAVNVVVVVVFSVVVVVVVVVVGGAGRSL